LEGFGQPLESLYFGKMTGSGLDEIYGQSLGFEETINRINRALEVVN